MNRKLLSFFSKVLIFILEIVFAFFLSIIIAIAGSRLTDIFGINSHTPLGMDALWFLFGFLIISPLVVYYIGEQFGAQNKAKKLTFAYTILGAFFPVLVGIILPRDEEYGLFFTILFAEYFLSPLCSAIFYNVSRFILNKRGASS